MNNVWLVADSESGLGRDIAEAVLESGDRLVATARDTKRLDDLEKQYGRALRGVGRQPADATTAMSPRRAP
jgi:NADP-dependent 3-hydroxy acid dehydrogenase YdfG